MVNFVLSVRVCDIQTPDDDGAFFGEYESISLTGASWVHSYAGGYESGSGKLSVVFPVNGDAFNHGIEIIN